MNEESSTSFLETEDDANNNSAELPTKECYVLAGKHFVVIDESIMHQLDLEDSSSQLFFQQYVDEFGCIVLRPYKMRG